MQLLQQRIRQFLIHSFLYYQLGETVISDAQYDMICQELQNLLSRHPEDQSEYRKIVEQSLGQEASGFSIKNYPPHIISSAIHLLYQSHYANSMKFSEYLDRMGYRAELF